MSVTLVVASTGLPDRDQALRLMRDLPTTERRRLERLKQPDDRLRSLAARALLRRLLAIRLGGPPDRIPLVRGPWGQPLLAGLRPAWHFSLAHSGAQILVAIGSQPVGVDVECCPAEADAALWEATTGERREGNAQAFCTEWVQREAVLKASGRGLALPPAALRLRAAGGGWRRAGGLPEVRGLQVRLLWQSPAHCAALCLPDAAAEWHLEQSSPTAWMCLPA